MLEISLNATQTFGLSVIVLLIGMFLVSKISFLSKYCIPAPVVGGVIFALLIWLVNSQEWATLNMDFAMKDVFMICFFTTVGFCADIQMLKKGGAGVVLFLGAASVLAFLQDALGVGLASLFNLNGLLGLAMGSVSMTGGHGTSGSFGPVLEGMGAEGATVVALASATYGLVAGCLIGGPIAKRLIEKNDLKATGVGATATAESGDPNVLNAADLSIGFFQIGVAVAFGAVVSTLFKKIGFTLPAYIGAMLIAALMRNTPGVVGETRIKEINALGSIFLAVFLAQALMSVKLWELADLAGPMVIILLAQTVLTGVFAYFVTFRVMGSDYDAAVISAGHCGFGMGATPNGVANMTSVVQKYFPSPKAFFILPIVGGMFIDFVNALIITGFAGFIK